jgi:hypothetical protein
MLAESDRDPPAAGRSESMRLLRKQGGVRERPPPGGLSFLSSHGQRLIPIGWLGIAVESRRTSSQALQQPPG